MIPLNQTLQWFPFKIQNKILPPCMAYRNLHVLTSAYVNVLPDHSHACSPGPLTCWSPNRLVHPVSCLPACSPLDRSVRDDGAMTACCWALWPQAAYVTPSTLSPTKVRLPGAAPARNGAEGTRGHSCKTESSPVFDRGVPSAWPHLSWNWAAVGGSSYKPPSYLRHSLKAPLPFLPLPTVSFRCSPPSLIVPWHLQTQTNMLLTLDIFLQIVWRCENLWKASPLLFAVWLWARPLPPLNLNSLLCTMRITDFSSCGHWRQLKKKECVWKSLAHSRSSTHMWVELNSWRDLIWYEILSVPPRYCPELLEFCKSNPSSPDLEECRTVLKDRRSGE